MTDSARDWGGPYICAALFCEHLLVESDQVTSAIRIVDRFYVPTEVPDGMLTVAPTAVKLYLNLKSGKARGSHKIVIEVETPSGMKGPRQEVSAYFEGEDRGAIVIVETLIPTQEPGLYWFQISTGSQLLTRMPLRVIERPIPLPTGFQPG